MSATKLNTQCYITDGFQILQNRSTKKTFNNALNQNLQRIPESRHILQTAEIKKKTHGSLK